MAIAAALIGTRGTSSTNTVSTVAGTSTGGSGNHGLIFVSFDASVTISTVADSKSNTWTLKDSVISSTGDASKIAVYYCLNWTGGASHNATVTFSGSAFPTCHLIEVTGAATSSPFDVSVTNAGQAHPFSVASGVLSQAAEAVFLFGEQNSGGTSADNYTSSNATLLSQEPDLTNFWTSGVTVAITAATGSVSYNLQKGTSSVTGAVKLFSVKEGGASGPVLSSPTGTSTGTTTAQGQVSTTGSDGTMYSVVSTSATPPSIAQIQAGNDSTGSAAAWSGNQAIASSGTKTFNATGLTASTSYYFYFQHQDAATNDSTVASSSQFTTDTPVAGIPTAWLIA